MRQYALWLGSWAQTVGGVPLGAPAELWRETPEHPANEWLHNKARDLDRPFDDTHAAYYTSRSLMLGVLQAAGAIEYTVERIDAAIAAVQAFADESDLISARDPAVPAAVASPAVDEAYIEYANLLNWLRTLFDRMRSRMPRTDVKLGLIPALAQRSDLRRRVETTFDGLDRRHRSEANLTNFGLHSQALPGGGTPTATVTQTGRVRLLIPDLPAERLYLFDQFTYGEDRDLSQFAHEVLDSVSSFIAELLRAFEQGTAEAMAARRQPDRARS
jgi:hypothetical protein